MARLYLVSPSKLLRSIRSFFIGWMLPLLVVFARASKSLGKRSRGRTKVCTVHCCFSGGVGSSRLTTQRVNTLSGTMQKCSCLRFDHVRAVTQTISRLFSWWLTIVLTLMLMTFNGGISLGASASVSGKGLMSFGSFTVASNLHQEI